MGSETKQVEPYPASGKRKPPGKNNAGQTTPEIHYRKTTLVQEEHTEAPKQDNPIPDRPILEPAENTMPEIHFRDPDEQRWIELEKQEIEKGHITPIRRDGYTLPGDPNTLIYPEKRRIDHWAEQVAAKWFGEMLGDTNHTAIREKYALRELGITQGEEE